MEQANKGDNPMNQIFLDLLETDHLNDFQKQMILHIADKNYRMVYDNLAQNAQVIGKDEIWESVLFCASLQIQKDINSGKINPDYCMSALWEKVLTIMNMKRQNISMEIQRKEMTS